MTTDLADDCIAWMRQQKVIAPKNRSSPTSPPRYSRTPPTTSRLAWQNKGKFDDGWDAYRETVYKRQLEMGVIPKGTRLTPRPKEIPSWAEQSDDAKKLMARQMENFADFLQHTDYEIGRLVDAVEDMANSTIRW